MFEWGEVVKGMGMMYGYSLEGFLELLVYVGQKCGSAELPCTTMEGFLSQLGC